mgnify:CR=1 FL=1
MVVGPAQYTLIYNQYYDTIPRSNYIAGNNFNIPSALQS